MIGRIIVVVLGLVVFLLLLFADKTNLHNQPDSVIDASVNQSNTQAPSTEGNNELPPLPEDEEISRLTKQLDEAKDEEKSIYLSSLIQLLEQKNHVAHAAEYAVKLAKLDRSSQNLVLLGRLHQQASELPNIAQDSVLYTKYLNTSIRALEEVVETEPENENALLYLGLAYTGIGKMEGVLTLKKVLEINPNNVEASFNLGIFSLQVGKFEKAVERFQTVSKLDPQNEAAQYYLAYAYVQLKNPSEARPLLENLAKNAGEPELKQQANQLLNTL